MISEKQKEKWFREGLRKRLDDLNYHLSSLKYSIDQLTKAINKLIEKELI